MLHSYSIKDLYPIALAEGEGMGTAYEYFAKRLILNRWLAGRPRPQSILIAGLPERYGVSLDFCLLATELGARLTVIDNRPQALAHLEAAVATIATNNRVPSIQLPQDLVLVDMLAMESLAGRYDLILSSEVLQRLSPVARTTYTCRLLGMADSVALFTPNADNDAHTSISGLSGLQLTELQSVIDSCMSKKLGRQIADIGYIDMPPFPPGITRSAEQRQHASTGWFEATAMWGLSMVARLERAFPQGIRQNRSHIIYAFIATKS